MLHDDTRSLATVNGQPPGIGPGGIKDIVLGLEERRRCHLNQGNFDAAALVDEQLQRVKTDELRRRLQQLDGQQAADLLHSENAHQQEFMELQTHWARRTRDFEEQAKRKRAELDQKHKLELYRLDQEQNNSPHTAARKYSGRVLQLEDQQKRLIRIRRYSEAKSVLSTINELKRRQDIQFEQARKKSQELERSHLLKTQAREQKVLRAKLQDEKSKLLGTKRETIELCIRRHQAQVGRAQHRNLKQKAKLQDDLRQHLGLQKSAAAAASATVCTAVAGQLPHSSKADRLQTASRTADRPPIFRQKQKKPASTTPSAGIRSGDREFQTMFRWDAHNGLPESASLDCTFVNRIHASIGSGVRYCEGAGHKPQRPLSAPVRSRNGPQTPNRPHSASRRTKGFGCHLGEKIKACDHHEAGTAAQQSQSMAQRSKWQGKNAYRHESTAITTKLAKRWQRPMSDI